MEDITQRGQRADEQPGHRLVCFIALETKTKLTLGYRGGYLLCLSQVAVKGAKFCVSAFSGVFTKTTNVNEPSCSSFDLHKVQLSKTGCQAVLTHVAHVWKAMESK